MSELYFKAIHSEICWRLSLTATNVNLMVKLEKNCRYHQNIRLYLLVEPWASLQNCVTIHQVDVEIFLRDMWKLWHAKLLCWWETVRRSPKFLGFILWTLWRSVQNFMGIQAEIVKIFCTKPKMRTSWRR